MNTIDVNKLRQKDKLTGHEIGKILIKNMCYTLELTNKGKDARPMFPPSEFTEMISRLATVDDWRIYNRYIGLNNFILRVRPVAISLLEQGYLRTHLLMDAISNAELSEYVHEQTITHKYNDLNKTICDTIGKGIGLEQYLPNNKDNASFKGIVKTRKDLEYTIHYIQGINLIFDMVASYIQLDDMQILKTDLSNIYNVFDELNEMQNHLCDIVDNSNQLTNIKNKKLDLIRDLFRPIKIDYGVPPENMERAKAMIENELSAFVINDGVIELLVTQLD